MPVPVDTESEAIAAQEQEIVSYSYIIHLTDSGEIDCIVLQYD